MASWFTKRYDMRMAKIDLSVPIARVLAYPCYVLDHAVGYTRVTKYLAYDHVGHVQERLPKGFRGPKHLHINERTTSLLVASGAQSAASSMVSLPGTFSGSVAPTCVRKFFGVPTATVRPMRIRHVLWAVMACASPTSAFRSAFERLSGSSDSMKVYQKSGTCTAARKRWASQVNKFSLE